jgi:hypothetical protein
MKTSNKISSQLLILGLSLFVLTSCTSRKTESVDTKIDISVVSTYSTTDKPVIVSNIIAKDYQPDFAPEQEKFDWENIEYLPVPFYAKTSVPVPWSDKSKRAFSDDIRYDIKKSDGWELYLSNVSSQMYYAVPSLTLYNKYRGILRYYYLNCYKTNGFQDYNILYSVIGTHNPISPLLNFAQQKIIDLNKNSNYCTTIEPQQLSDSTWYAVEYELAYDKNIYKQSSSTLQLYCSFSMLKAYALSLNGIRTSKLNAKIRFSDVNMEWGYSYSGDVSLILYGKNDLNQVKDALSISDLTSLNQTMNQQSFDDVLNGTMNNNACGDIQWNANLIFAYSLSGVGILTDSFYVSGADNSSKQGLCPFYTKALGVFYLNKKPTYTATKLVNNGHPYIYKLDVSSVEYVFNPSVTDIAEIKNIKQELVSTENKSLFHDNSNDKLYTGQTLASNIPLTIQGVRVSFDVVPKNGSKTVHIVKTFQADLISSN